MSIENKFNEQKLRRNKKKVGGIARREKKTKSEPIHCVIKYVKVQFDIVAMIASKARIKIFEIFSKGPTV